MINFQAQAYLPPTQFADWYQCDKSLFQANPLIGLSMAQHSHLYGPSSPVAPFTNMV